MGFLGQANQAQGGQPARRRLYGSPAGDAMGGGIPDPNSQVKSLFANNPVTMAPANLPPQPAAPVAGESTSPSPNYGIDIGQDSGYFSGNRGGNADGFMTGNFFSGF